MMVPSVRTIRRTTPVRSSKAQSRSNRYGDCQLYAWSSRYRQLTAFLQSMGRPPWRRFLGAMAPRHPAVVADRTDQAHPTRRGRVPVLMVRQTAPLTARHPRDYSRPTPEVAVPPREKVGWRSDGGRHGLAEGDGRPEAPRGARGAA